MSQPLKFDVLKTYTNIEKKKRITSISFSDTKQSRFFEVNQNNLEDTVVKTKHSNSKSESTNHFYCEKTSYQMNNIEKSNIGNTYSAWFPNNWKNHLDNIKKMRKNRTAPVDEMGCHKCADELANEKVFRFQTLIALMLSSQTKDQITYRVMQRLKERNCTPESINCISDEELGKLIFPVNFWKVLTV
jgi:hypothetical protein